MLSRSVSFTLSRHIAAGNLLRRRLFASTTAESSTSVNHSATSTAASASDSSVPIATSLVAAVLGVATVSGVAFVTENATASSVPAFDIKGQRYEQSHFGGRFARMLLACDPRLLFYTEDQVRQAKRMLDQLDDNNKIISDRALWEAKRMVDAAMHPDTGEIIPRPFRMSGYIPYNGPICVSMVASQSTLPLLFWSWVNQSQNALINYYNRNAASPMSNETLAISYTTAVGSALVVAFGLATFIQKRYDPVRAKALLKWVAFPSAVVASSLNCYIVRSPEIETGIPLQNAAGENVHPGETSQVAATRGVNSTTASRALLQAPVYFLPPMLISVFGRGYLARHPAMTVPLTTYLLLVSFGVGLPATIAIFPQMSEIDASQVEKKFQHLRDPATQQPYKVFYYNKGL